MFHLVCLWQQHVEKTPDKRLKVSLPLSLLQCFFSTLRTTQLKNKISSFFSSFQLVVFFAKNPPTLTGHRLCRHGSGRRFFLRGNSGGSRGATAALQRFRVSCHRGNVRLRGHQEADSCAYRLRISFLWYGQDFRRWGPARRGEGGGGGGGREEGSYSMSPVHVYD